MEQNFENTFVMFLTDKVKEKINYNTTPEEIYSLMLKELLHFDHHEFLREDYKVRLEKLLNDCDQVKDLFKDIGYTLRC